MGVFFLVCSYYMHQDEDVRPGDLVKCYNWQYYGEMAIVLRVCEDALLIYIFDDKAKKKLHKSLLSMFKRLMRGKKNVDGFIAWTSNEHALIVKIETTSYGIEDVTLRFPEGEIVVMSKKTIVEIFELVSEAP